MKRSFISKQFRGAGLAIIEQAVSICEEYRRQGYTLTLRQIYYQFVARDLLPNNLQSYKRLGSILNDARLAGMLDWNHMTDRTRYLRGYNSWSSPSSIIQGAATQFSRDLWEVSQQVYRPEVWVEKDALVDIVARACEEYRVPFMSCRGYVSQSEMYDAGMRMGSHLLDDRLPVVIHLGDHDPSGIDMTRDIEDRLQMFAGRPVPVHRVALTMTQIEEYNPPPNFAKITDSRSDDYIQRYGDQSWELDALEPQVINNVITDALAPFIAVEDWNAARDEDLRMRERMTTVADRWDDIDSRWEEIELLLEE